MRSWPSAVDGLPAEGPIERGPIEKAQARFEPRVSPGESIERMSAFEVDLGALLH